MRIPKQPAVREILCSRTKLPTARFFNGTNSDPQPASRPASGPFGQGPYPPCLRMADRALLAGYPRYYGYSSREVGKSGTGTKAHTSLINHKHSQSIFNCIFSIQLHHCLPNRLFGCRSEKTSKLRVTGLCAGNSPETGEFSAQMASNAENVTIWWRHHGIILWLPVCQFSELLTPLAMCSPLGGLYVSGQAWP